jgi:hypothetical protein
MQGPAPASHWENHRESLQWSRRPPDGQKDSRSVPGSRQRQGRLREFQVPRNDFFHGNIIAPGATLCEPELLPTMEA